jgi:MYXO-CTERM domain-containing protein
MACIGSGTFTHLGLNLIQANIASYKAECSVDGRLYPCSDADRVHQHPRHRRQVQLVRRAGPGAAQAMFMDGITTYVIGFGDLVGRRLERQAQQHGRLGLGQRRGLLRRQQPGPARDVPQEHPRAADLRPLLLVQRLRDQPEPTTDRAGSDGRARSQHQQQRRARHRERHHRRRDGHGHRLVHHRPVDPSTTNDPSNPSSATETDPTTDPTDGGTSDTAGETGVIPTTGGNTTPPDPTGDDESASSSEGSDRRRDTTGVDDEGCGCKVDDSNNTRGLLGTLFTLGLAGFIRRRRRA